MQAPPLFGLVLTGGASRRMQRDKALLDYHGKSQLEHAYDLLHEVCATVFVSVRADQRTEPLRARFAQIVDRNVDIGPLAGIAAALTEHPTAAWLVVACDLPYLTADTLKYLCTHRDAVRVATAYRSEHDGLPEPLCAIWEPGSRELVLSAIAADKRCPRKLLIAANAAIIDVPTPHALDNVNTPAESVHATTGLRTETKAPAPAASAARKTLRVQYFALMREQAGRSEETLDTAAATPAALYAEIKRTRPMTLAQDQLRVAVNAEFSHWNVELKHGDTVVFIPPVAGG